MIFKKLSLSLLLFCFCAPLIRAETPTTVRIPPVLWYESDPAEQKRFLMALMLYWSAHAPQEKFDLFAPFYYSSQTPEEKIRVFLPLHFRYWSKDLEMELWGPYFQKSRKTGLRTQTKFLFPLYFQTSSWVGTRPTPTPPDTQLTFLTLYLHHKNPEFTLDVLFPLYWNYQPSQPSLKSYQTLFPLYLKVSSDQSRSLISLLFWAYKDPQISQGLIPPYYWRFKANSKAQVLFPLYWRFFKQKEQNKFRDIEVAIPWFRYSTQTSSFRTFFPLYWGRTYSTPPLNPSGVSLGEAVHNSTQSWSWHLVIPVFLSSYKPDGSYRIMTPLFSKFRDMDGREYGHSGLNFFSRETWGAKTEGLLPLFYYHEEPDFFQFRFLPYYVESHKNQQRFETSFFPLFRYRRDFDRKQFLTPFFYADRDPETHRGFFLNYFWTTHFQTDQGARSITFKKRFLIPLAWHYQSESEKITFMLPMTLWREHENYKLSMIFPFYYRRQKAEDTLTVIPPFIRRQSPRRDWTGAFFIFWHGRKDSRSSLTLFPLYRKSKFPGGYSVLFPGLYYLKDKTGSQGFVFPYFWDQRGETQYSIFFPLYYDFKRPTWMVRSAFPVYAFRSSRIKEKGIFPFWAVTKPVEPSTQSFTVPVSTESETDFKPSTAPVQKHFLADSHRLLPFYFYRKLDHGYDLWLPVLLGHIEKDLDVQQQPMIRGRMLLIYYWEKRPQAYLHRMDPLFYAHKSPDQKGFSIPTAPFPLWQYERGGLTLPLEDQWEQGAFFPYYWWRTPTYTRRFVVPLFYSALYRDQKTRLESSRTTWLLLYYANQNRIESTSKRIVFPLYWHFAERDESTTVIPPVWTERGPHYKRTLVFPLWWNSYRDGESMTVLFPLFFKTRDQATQRKTVILPGFWRSQDPEGSTLLAGNFFQSRSFTRQETTRVLFPLFWSSAAPLKETATFFPLYWKWKTDVSAIHYFFPIYLRHQSPTFTWNVVFPLYWKFKTTETQVRVVPPYFSILSLKDQTKTSGFAPLWIYSRNTAQDWKNFQILGGFFGYERQGTKKTIRLLYWIKL